jgi:7-cyano-7-deazaguanine synthase in queuosine biosynthesis
MIFENSQDTIEISIPLDIKNVGIKLSGGADSAIVCYMLAMHVVKERTDVSVYAITCNAEGKEYQVDFARRVMLKINELTGLQFAGHLTATARTDSSEHYTADQDSLIDTVYTNNIVDMHFAGITANPNQDEAPELYINRWEMPSDDRSKLPTKRPKQYGRSYCPLINIDKRGVAELYCNLGVIDSLFPVTRSCEAYTANFTKHCGKCWFCKERFWGFGRYT